MFSLGLGLMLSTFAIYFVDIVHMYGIALTAWMYWSPIIYRPEMLPEEYLWILKLNPMFYLITLFRLPVYYGQIPTFQQFLISGAIALITLLAGWWIFTNKADEFAYRV